MTEALQNLFWILIFPGFLFTIVLGLVACWIVRKVSALVQWRVGPPLLQPFYDVMKLMGKETLIPQDAQRTVFIAAPIVGLAGVLLLSTMLWRTTITQTDFVGDIIVDSELDRTLIETNSTTSSEEDTTSDTTSSEEDTTSDTTPSVEDTTSVEELLDDLTLPAPIYTFLIVLFAVPVIIKRK